MKTEAAAFVDWFEKERERTIDRILKMLGEEAYEGIGCGLVMELHQQALTTAAARVAEARVSAGQRCSGPSVLRVRGVRRRDCSGGCIPRLGFARTQEAARAGPKAEGFESRRGPSGAFPNGRERRDNAQDRRIGSIRSKPTRNLILTCAA